MKGLTKLPVFDLYLAYSLTRIYLNGNYINYLHQDILATWRSVELIDLIGNPIECTELNKIPASVKIITDCHKYTTSKPETTMDYIPALTSTVTYYQTSEKGKYISLYIYIYFYNRSYQYNQPVIYLMINIYLFLILLTFLIR